MSDTLRGDILVDGRYQALPDAVTDRLFGLVSSLLAEVWTTRDRVRLLEAALGRQGLDVDVESSVPETDHDLAAMRADRDAFIARVFRPVTPNAEPLVQDGAQP